MQKQLLLYLLAFVFISIYLLQQSKQVAFIYLCATGVVFLSVFAFTIFPSILLISWGFLSLGFLFTAYFLGFPKDDGEESIYSREFWLFAGAFVLFLSSITISIFTSIPIFNKLFGMSRAPFTPEKFNSWQIPFAIFVAFMMAIAQFYKYRNTDKKQFFRSIRIAALLALLFGLVASIALYFTGSWESADSSQKINYIEYTLLLITSAFALFANTGYWIRILKGKLKSAGASIAHIGFALLLIGALISTSKKATLSRNTSQKSVSSLGKDFNDKKSILLVKGDTLPMGPYYVSYSGKEKEGINLKFKVEYFSRDNNTFTKKFELYPLVQLNQRMGNTPEPDTRHFLSHDIYTHVTYADLSVKGPKPNDYSEPQNNIIHLHDTLFATNSIIVVDSLRSDVSQEQYQKNDSAITVTAVLKAYDIDTKVHWAYPKYHLIRNRVEPVSDSIPELGLRFSFWKINPTDGSIEIMMSERRTNQKDFIVMEAYMFPYINVLWLGCVVMVLGTALAVWQRIRGYVQA
jgi:cytochrome c-type biogenesis protein CcmF